MRHATRVLLAAAALASQAAFAQALAPPPTVAAARAAAHADRNAESAELFSRAIQAEPALRRELLQEYADQLLYSQRGAEALPLYREVLAAPRNDNERLRAMKGLGVAYLWTDRPTQARGVFEQLVREQPADEDASRNLGRALSWSGRQREASAHLRQHLARHPSDGEARVLLAQAQAWMGRRDTALATLDGVAREDAARVRREVQRDIAPVTALAHERSTQSDNLDIRSWRLAQSFDFAQGRGTVGARLDRQEYERSDTGESATVTRPMLLGRYRLSDAVEWHGEVGGERISPDSGGATAFTAYNTWITFWPNDVLRFDASAGRGDFDNLKSLRLGLTHRDAGLSMDVTPAEAWRGAVRVQRMEISDGNRRDMGQLEGEYRWRTHPEVWVGARYTRFEFARLMDSGYFNPLRFESLLATLRVGWRPGGGDSPWEVDARAAWGRERAVPDGDKPAYDVSLRAAYRFGAAYRVQLKAQRFSSRTGASAGFARTSFGASVERSW